MGKFQAKTTATKASVTGFIAALDNDTRRADAKTLLKLLKDITGWKPKMWGPTIIGFGAYHYTCPTGHSGSICAIGFSPRAASLVIYAAHFPGRETLLKSLGKYKPGKGCLYINKLADVDMGVLRKLLAGGLAQIRKDWPVTAS